MHGDVGPGTICTAGTRAARQRRWRGPGSLLVVLLLVPDLLVTDKFSLWPTLFTINYMYLCIVISLVLAYTIMSIVCSVCSGCTGADL